jgi:hypothetical protein
MEEALGMRRGLPFLLLLAALASCIPTVLPSIPTLPGPTVTANPNATPSPTPFGPDATLPATGSPSPAPAASPSPVPQSDLTLYSLDALLDTAAHTLAVDEQIVYRNGTGAALPNVVLAVEPNHWAGCFTLETLEVNGQPAANVIPVGHRLEVPLAPALDPGGSVRLSLSYRLALPQADSTHLFGYYPDQLNLVDWYPFIVPYDPVQGWLLHPVGNAGEHLVYDLAAFDLRLRFSGPARAPIVAASAPGSPLKDGWHYQLPAVRSFALSASTQYASESLPAAGVLVTGYYFPSEQASARTVLTEVARAVSTYTGLFGPSPYPSLAIVESPFFDGLEFDGLFFLSRTFYTSANGTVLDNLVDIGVHETAHQWWFAAVGNDQALEPWLDEALATYGEWLFYQQNYPQVTAWWAFRVEAYSPSGWVDTDIYSSGGFRPYANAVYLRGAQFLQALRGQIGDPAFFAFLKDYYARMSGKRATGGDFFRLLSQHTDMDLSALVAAYFQHSH